jgi:Haem-binding domain
MNRLTKYAVVTLVVVGFGIQFVRPARTNPTTHPVAALAAHVRVPPDVAAILDRACRDCHSNDTRWPWYSNVAPVSWWVIDHVNHGRSHFNYSEWAKYPPDEVAKLLEGSCELARKGAMPLPSYLWMHRNARLSAEDVDAVCQWTSGVDRRANR